MDYIVMAYIVMASIVMARRGRRSDGGSSGAQASSSSRFFLATFRRIADGGLPRGAAEGPTAIAGVTIYIS